MRTTVFIWEQRCGNEKMADLAAIGKEAAGSANPPLSLPFGDILCVKTRAVYVDLSANHSG
jgi:hypothetical protein